MNDLLEVHEVFTTLQGAKDSFDYIVDYSHIDQWDHTILESSKVGSEPIKLGTRFELLYARSEQEIPISYEITEFIPARKAVLTGTSSNFTAIDIITVDHLDRGCRIDWLAKVDFFDLEAPINPETASKIKESMRETLRGLKSCLDAQVN